jgi:transposase InsO family protein
MGKVPTVGARDGGRAAPLVKRRCSPTQGNAAWATDITDIRTWQGWLYLAVVIDLLSRKVIGWAAGPTIHRELVLDALASAVKQRGPRGTIITPIRVCNSAVTPGGASAVPITSSRA